MIYKTNESTIVIQAEARDQQRSDVVFWSHDRGTAKLRMKLMQKSGVPQTLPEGTTVPIRLTFQSNTAQNGIGKHDYLATIEDKVNGIVSIVLQDNILGYVGIVHGSVYLNFPENKSLDTAGRFSFEIRRSPIDESTPELEDYYFNGFSQTIDKVEKMIADAKKEIDTKLADTNSKITKANNDLTTLNTNLNKTQTQIGELGKLKRVYSNNINFGDYDYSGNTNLMRVINAVDFTSGSDVTISDVGYNSIRLTSQGVNSVNAFTSNNIPSLVSGKKYTISAKVKIEDGTTGNIDKLRLCYRKANGGTILLSAITTGIEVGKEITIKNTAVVNYNITELSKFYLTIDTDSSAKINGSVIVSDIKLEEGATATPYQPNLQDAPYYLSKTPLGENIASKTVTFPIKSSEFNIYVGDTKEDLVIGQTYTITLKGTKPASQTFAAFNRWDVKFGDLKPVEGLTDVWFLTFTPTKLVPDFPKNFRIYQSPEATAGACQIDWLKLEKGDARTPNITQYKYYGESIKDSNNPKDYSWDVTPEFTESGLNNSVSLTSPQTVLGVKNFKEGLQVNGKSVTTLSDLDKIAITTISNNDGSLSNFNLNGSTFGFGSSMRTTGTVQAFTRNANKQLICNVAGTYVFNGQLSVQTGVPIDGWHYVEIRVNSKVVDLVWARGLQSFKSKWNFSGMIQFNLKAGDVIDFISSSSETGATSGLFMSCPLATFQRIGD